jgi:hypothetical protein
LRHIQESDVSVMAQIASQIRKADSSLSDRHSGADLALAVRQSVLFVSHFDVDLQLAGLDNEALIKRPVAPRSQVR